MLRGNSECIRILGRARESPACIASGAFFLRLGDRLIKPHPNSRGGEFDEGEVVGVVLFVARGDGPEVFELAEEALDEVAISVEEAAEGRDVPAVWHRLDVGPGAAGRQIGSEGVAVVGTVGEQDLAVGEGGEHIGGTPAVMGLAFAQLQRDRQSVGIDQGVDLGCQPAPRAPHAAAVSCVPNGSIGGVQAPFLTFAAC